LSEDFLAPSSDSSRILISAIIIPLDFTAAAEAEDVHEAACVWSGVLGEDVCEAYASICRCFYKSSFDELFFEISLCSSIEQIFLKTFSM